MHVPCHEAKFRASMLERREPTLMEHLAGPPDDLLERDNWAIQAGYFRALQAAGIASWRRASAGTMTPLLQALMDFGFAWLRTVAAGPGREVTVQLWGKALKVPGIRRPSEFLYPVTLDVCAIAAWLGRDDIVSEVAGFDIPIPCHPGLGAPESRTEAVRALVAQVNGEDASEHIEATRRAANKSATTRQHAAFMDTPLTDALDALQRWDRGDFDRALVALLEGHRHFAAKHPHNYDGMIFPLGIGVAALGWRRGLEPSVTSGYLPVSSACAPGADPQPRRVAVGGWEAIDPGKSAILGDVVVTVELPEEGEPTAVGKRGERRVFRTVIVAPFGNHHLERWAEVCALDENLTLVAIGAEHSRGAVATNLHIVDKAGQVRWRIDGVDFRAAGLAVGQTGRQGQLRIELGGRLKVLAWQQQNRGSDPNTLHFTVLE